MQIQLQCRACFVGEITAVVEIANGRAYATLDEVTCRHDAAAQRLIEDDEVIAQALVDRARRPLVTARV